MNNIDPSAHSEAEDAASEPELQSAAVTADEDEVPVREPVIVAQEQQVELQRSVRYGRVLIGSAILGAAIVSLLSLIMPLGADFEYTMAQVVGFMALIGAAIGLGLGAVLSLVLGAAAKRKHGSGVAIQTDVR